MAKRSKYTVIDAPRRVRLAWARKAAVTRRKNLAKKLRDCRDDCTTPSISSSAKRSRYPSVVAPMLHSSVSELSPYERAYAKPSLAQEAEKVVADAGGMADYSHMSNPRRRFSRNPELMVMHNPGRHYRGRAGLSRLSIQHRRTKNMRRRKKRNHPLTVLIGGKRRSYRGFIKRSMKGGKMTMKQAARKWKRSKKFHGSSKTRVAANGRRKRRYNSWKGHRAAHARAARKGWRKRKNRGGKRRAGRKSSRRRCPSRGRKGSWKRLVKKYGVKGAKKHYHCKRRSKRRKK